MLWVRCKQVHEAISFAAALPLPAVEDGGAGDDGAEGMKELEAMGEQGICLKS
jgi:hypothetical protein